VTHTLVLTTYDERFVMDVEVFQVKAWLFLLKIKWLEYLLFGRRGLFGGF
jgi:hypothetical protein